MSVLNKTELNILSVMYDGDKNRDATSKIRGFLFQDYVTIKCLLKNKVEYVCSEYLEDVDVLGENDTFEFIQVKYYPNANLNMKEISTDLYYQYLRLQMLHSTLTAIPSLYIHKDSKVKKPTLDKMKAYIGLKNKLPKSRTYGDIVAPESWLREQVYPLNKKEQKEKLFAEMASETSLNEFIKKFGIRNQSDINSYKENLMIELAAAFPNPDKNGEGENWQLILLGLAITYIQRRYTLVEPCFNQLRVKKTEFDEYMKNTAKNMTEQTIASYLVGIVCEEYGGIISNNNLSDLQTHMLNLIYQNTIRWINEIGKNVDGQYQLLNTVSKDEAIKIEGYREWSINDRLIHMAECKTNFLSFLDYFWKIMLDICQRKVNSEQMISNHSELFEPYHYIVGSVTSYICLNFPADKYVDYSVILPPAGGKFKGEKRKIIDRMLKITPKPGKWFFENSALVKGKNYYNYSTANVNDNPTVADLGEDSFYIECMDCIGIDENDWSKQEFCDDCIFSEKCINEGR